MRITIATLLTIPTVAAHTVLDSTPAGEPHGWPLQLTLICAAVGVALAWLIYWLATRRP